MGTSAGEFQGGGVQHDIAIRGRLGVERRLTGLRLLANPWVFSVSTAVDRYVFWLRG